MLVKFLKIFFSILALMLFAFLVNVTFYFSNYFKNIDFISSITLKEDNSIYELNNSGVLNVVKFSSGETLTGVFIGNISKIDKIYFSQANSYKVEKLSGSYEISLDKGLFLLDLNDLSVDYKIKGLGFEIEPKSAGMIFIDTTNSQKTLVFSINSIFKFVFKSETGRKVNYYYMYPHNYLIFDVKNNTFSRIGGDVFRIKTIVSDGFFKEKLKNNLDLRGLLKGEKLGFFKSVFSLIKKEYSEYNVKFKKLKTLESFSLIGQDYINKYFDYFINNTKKRIYYKQSILNSIQELYNQKVTSTDVSQDIIDKLEKLKSYNLKDYNDVLSVLKGYYKVILKNNSLEDKVILDNFLPLIKYLKLVDSKKVKDLDDLVSKIQSNQSKIFSSTKTREIYSLSKENLDYLYLLRNIDKQIFNKLVVVLELKYKEVKKQNISKNRKNLIDKYYYGVLNLKQGNDDLELYVLLKNIFFSYDFSSKKFDLEKYFKNFVDIYFSKLKVENGEIIVGQHIDIVLLKSFLYYLDDYLNNFAFNVNFENKKIDKDSKDLEYNIDILEKYLFLNKYVYFKNNSLELLQTGIFKNKELLANILKFVRNKLFKEKKEDGLLVSSFYYNLPKQISNKFSQIINNFFLLEQKNKDKIANNSRFKVLLEDYDKLYEKYKEYFLALLNYEEYKTKYSKLDSQLDNYKIDIKEETLGKEDIIHFLSQFYGANFSNTEIIQIKNSKEFLVKNFEVNGGVMTFKINPEKGYLISNIIIESNPEIKDKFYKNSYSLEREKDIWTNSKVLTNNEVDFGFYFRDKFFNNKVFDKSDSIENSYFNNKNKNDNESETIRIFKRDKLLGKNGEFSSIKDILKISYNNIKVKDLKNILIEKAEVLSDKYKAIFSSKYLIDIEKNEHYFYNKGGIEVFLLAKDSNNNRNFLLKGNPILLNFDISIDEFRGVFSDIFENLKKLNNFINSLNNYYGLEKINIIYNKSKIFYINFIYNNKKVEFYIKNGKVIKLKIGNKILNEFKNRNIETLGRFF